MGIASAFGAKRTMAIRGADKTEVAAVAEDRKVGALFTTGGVSSVFGN